MHHLKKRLQHKLASYVPMSLVPSLTFDVGSISREGRTLRSPTIFAIRFDAAIPIADTNIIWDRQS